MNIDVDLRHLEAFVAAARHGSFTKAARTLQVSQPSFTVQIRQLETALGVRLLDRNTRSVQLTRIGRELAPVLERLLMELELALENAQALSTNVTGLVAMAALPSLSATLLPPILSAFKLEHSGVSIVLRDAMGSKIAAMVKAGEVDFGFGASPTEPDLEFDPIFKDRMSAIFKPDSPLRRKKRLSLSDVTEFPLILMDRDTSVRALVDGGLASIGYYASPAYEATAISTALALVKAGLGVSILPASVLSMDGAHGLASNVIHQPDLNRDIGLIKRRGRSLSPAAEALMRAVRAGVPTS